METIAAKLSDTTVLIAALVLFAVVAVILLRSRLKRINWSPLSGASVETHSPSDVSTVRRIEAAGTDVEVGAVGKGSSIEDVSIDPTSKNVKISSSTK
ncbi:MULTISPECIES: hypothetical protein [unclassified Bradyrhizobium]|uniref:hypothetical protein n=1 Tax=unclassified Bradyrhizobium TaxID=2631580 RepID=UPI0020B2DDBB|nr:MULTISPECIES: hypothetical protein [unclassified Bradyrhizobium]MCP3380002.1 hypothetical protein [Bradyrhizobium sp. CCGUVB4N]MCP3440840.1 hypothetical protein [Bradyrhizobium sp. CCGUVB14]